MSARSARSAFAHALLALPLWAASCSSVNEPSESLGTGGAMVGGASVGGTSVAGSTSGGAISLGGASSLGGANGLGGVSSAGGTTSLGGAKASLGGANGLGGGTSFGGATTRSGGAPGFGGHDSVAGANAAGAGGGEQKHALRVFIAGDSTVQTYTDTASTKDQAGWGQMLGALFDQLVTVDNRAIGGRTARRFVDEGRLQDILDDLHADDYLLVQFGTNDSNRTATYDLNGQSIPYYLDPNTDFKHYLGLYIDGAHTRGAVPVLVTPPPRNSAYCTGGNGTGAYATAMRELGAADSVAVLDLNDEAVTYLKAICPAPTPEDFFLIKSDGTVDGTHFQENGARILARFVTEEMKRVALPLADYLK